MALLIVLLAFSAAMLAPGLVIGPSLDAAVFSQVGARLLDGAVPYVDLWDHKTPGIYLASAAAQAVLGWLGPWTAGWLLSVGVTAALGVAVARVLGQLGVAGWPRPVAAAAATVLAGHYLLALGGGLTEAPATALVAWALAWALAPGEPSGARLTWIGALLAGSLLLSVQLLPAAIAVFGLALAVAPVEARPLRATTIIAGSVVPLAVVGGWLASVGALPAALDQVVGYSAAYRASSAGYGATLAAPVIAWLLLVSLFLVAPALLGAAGLAAQPQPRRVVRRAAIAWIVASIALFAVQGRFYAHYAIPLVVPLGILAALGLERTAMRLARPGQVAARVIVAAPLVATLLVSAVSGVFAAAAQMEPVADAADRRQAVTDRLRSEPEGALLVWGNEPWLYAETGRDPATSYLYLYPLTTPGYTTEAMVLHALADLEARPPAVIVDAGSTAPGEPGFLPLLIDRAVTTDGRDLDLLDPLRAFVAEHYELVDTASGWPIYHWMPVEAGL